MNLKKVLNSIVGELEHAEAMVAAIEGALIAKGLIHPDDVKKRLPELLPPIQNHFAEVRTLIEKL
jgi:hypothetical protein